MSTVVALFLAYFLGAIPWGIVFCRLANGRDPREHGSSRTGGTNVYRTSGPIPAILTVGFDVAKGYAAVILASQLSGGSPIVISLAAVLAIAGHNWSVFAGFKGGAGTTPNVGALLAIFPQMVVVALGLSAITLIIWRQASRATIINSLATTGATGGLALLVSPAYLLYGVGQLALVLYALYQGGNLRRLIHGNEIRAERIR
ncbi:hypothetical protein A3H80_00830 [Candidatus Roizmanbacteria bacterium RIFCSPLOWO2_02_FULL_37_19]|uniref:Glycerol-3-phosphate acyltransferase n=1 Tax=Candidatus Roizmanbacteria bacterium RIFCSPHIGHO2_02_FULL_37_24 TaxID=1802037 RepID=A0A1F7GUI7_9BACT|nr:MAG: hypothetical protein A3C24_00635 [Candidatus Roizmanbacteria bacterium RIFCSPHIGHO2_02_FULL_37_24]OGK32530.1 MAG: hypothetical protein A3E10_00700 [Candidatus Roizmanbacteria bacterium RIFCSPHIGHO2_12_FULL_37_23]OGK43734.1 MAG: hypothetical protein A2956_01400 [Candidatus Roizmanbacteria bacterium RIFCSPLOWO2_01_FULL_37_57]OGK54510.1 MAG: hypothetical protein A3H80_00830 [Candidatus Roizmanbacteria bacterium RIFCSPLOWO2_02_FULL_37_19]